MVNKSRVFWTIYTYHKPESILQVDVPDAPKAPKEAFHIFLAGLVAQPAHINPAHDRSLEWLTKSQKKSFTRRSNFSRLETAP